MKSFANSVSWTCFPDPCSDPGIHLTMTPDNLTPTRSVIPFILVTGCYQHRIRRGIGNHRRTAKKAGDWIRSNLPLCFPKSSSVSTLNFELAFTALAPDGSTGPGRSAAPDMANLRPAHQSRLQAHSGSRWIGA